MGDVSNAVLFLCAKGKKSQYHFVMSWRVGGSKRNT